MWLFALAGQSNMAGRGLVEPEDTISYPGIITLGENNIWQYANEPLHYYEPNLSGLDCGMAFGKKLIEFLPDSIVIGLILCAIGGSSIEKWLSDEPHRDINLLSNFKDKVKYSSEYGVLKAILWHQGESDANDVCIPSYYLNLDSLIHIFREISKDKNLPVLYGELGSFSKSELRKQNCLQINNIIEDISANIPNVFVIKTDDLKDIGDHVHFDSQSQRILGFRYAVKYLENVLIR